MPIQTCLVLLLKGLFPPILLTIYLPWELNENIETTVPDDLVLIATSLVSVHAPAIRSIADPIATAVFPANQTVLVPTPLVDPSRHKTSLCANHATSLTLHVDDEIHPTESLE